MPIEADLLPVIEGYLDSRAIRFPTTLKSTSGHGLSRWPTIIVIPSNPIHTGERPALISRVEEALRRTIGISFIVQSGDVGRSEYKAKRRRRCRSGVAKQDRQRRPLHARTTGTTRQ